MRKLFFTMLAFMLFSGVTLHAQVTIGSDATPDENALLDLKNKPDGTSDKGILLPRVKLQNTQLPAPLTAHTAGMVVYNTETTGDITPGYYCNDGKKWVKIEGANNVWSLKGNAGTDTSVNFIGTTDEKDIVFKRNNVLSGIISTETTTFGYMTPSHNAIYGPVAFGAMALYGYKGLQSTGVGNACLASNNNFSSYNTAMGYLAATGNYGDGNTVMGAHAMEGDVSAIPDVNKKAYNTVVGAMAMSAAGSEGSHNVVIGAEAQPIGNSSNNTLLGTLAITKGNFNTAVGKESFANGSKNISIGYKAAHNHNNLAFNTSNKGGDHNIAIGDSTLNNISDTIGDYRIVIGSGIQGIGKSNYLNIANSLYGRNIYSDSVRIGIGYGNTSPTNPLHIKGKAGENPLRLENLQTSSTVTEKVLTTDNTGVVRARAGVFGNIRTIEAGGTITPDDYTLLATGNLTMPPATEANKGQIYVILNVKTPEMGLTYLEVSGTFFKLGEYVTTNGEANKLMVFPPHGVILQSTGIGWIPQGYTEPLITPEIPPR